MFNDVSAGDRIKVYVDGGADFTGEYRRSVQQGFVDHCVLLKASNDKVIRIRYDAVVAVVVL